LQKSKCGEKAKSQARVSTSDPQARVMKQSDGGLALSYNAQISTDAAHGLIVGVSVTQEANDSAQLLPAVDQVKERLQKKPRQMVADGGYTTRDNIQKLADQKVDFLGSMRWVNVPSGATTPNRLPPSAFVYQPESNRYICPEGKLLSPQGRRLKRPGLIYYRYEAQAEDCRDCIRKTECCPGNEKRGRSVMRPEESPVVIAFREKMATGKAQEQYQRRGRVVEFCHAWIKSKLGLRQFHVRGQAKAGTELLWACFTYNLQNWIRLGKLHAAPATS
jgi:hypothetical protein